jgi:predicted dehydrogenase
MRRLLDMPGVRVTAVCDVYDDHRERARGLVAGHASSGGRAPAAFTRHEDLLAQKDVDAVLIGTPDHWHVPCTVAACEAGKDVYVEKPLTHTLEEGAAVIEAQNRHRRVVQVGTQQRSMPHFQRAKELIARGALGPVRKIHMTWNRNAVPIRRHAPDVKEGAVDWKRFLGSAKPQPFDPYRLLGNWRWFWDFGAGILGDLMVHWQDSINYLLDLPMPASAVAVGDSYEARDVWETPDTIQTLLNYPDRRLQVHFEGTFVNQHTRAHLVLMGAAATMILDRGRCVVTPEPRSATKEETFGGGVELPGSDFDRGVDGDALHLSDWLAAVRERRKPVCPAEAGVLAAAAAHLGNLAFRENRVAFWTR